MHCSLGGWPLPSCYLAALVQRGLVGARHSCQCQVAPREKAICQVMSDVAACKTSASLTSTVLRALLVVPEWKRAVCCHPVELHGCQLPSSACAGGNDLELDQDRWGY